MKKIAYVYFKNNEIQKIETCKSVSIPKEKWKASINDWNIYIDGNNIIVNYKEGNQMLQIIIYKNGFYKYYLIDLLSDEKIQLKGGFLTKDKIGELFKTEGVLGLSSGNIEERFIFYRTKAYQEFITKFDINKVITKTPNQIYTKSGVRKIKTDGLISEQDTFYEVEDASYTIVTDKHNSNIVYTMLERSKLPELVH